MDDEVRNYPRSDTQFYKEYQRNSELRSVIDEVFCLKRELEILDSFGDECPLAGIPKRPIFYVQDRFQRTHKGFKRLKNGSNGP